MNQYMNSKSQGLEASSTLLLFLSVSIALPCSIALKIDMNRRMFIYLIALYSLFHLHIDNIRVHSNNEWEFTAIHCSTHKYVIE